MKTVRLLIPVEFVFEVPAEEADDLNKFTFDFPNEIEVLDMEGNPIKGAGMIEFRTGQATVLEG